VQRPLPWRSRIGFISGHVFNDLCASMWFSYLVLYFNYVLEFSHSMSGAIMLVGQVADALATPFAGRESDKSAALCGRYGKRKGWHLFGTLLVASSFPFIFVGCLACGDSSRYVTSDLARFLYYAPFVVIFQFGWASVQISHLCFIPELTSCANERTWLNSGRVAMTVLSNIAVYVAMWQMLALYVCPTCEIGPDDGIVFRTVGLAVVGLGLAFAAAFHLTVKEKTGRRELLSEAAVDDPIERRRNVSESLSQPDSVHSIMSWTDWFKEPQYYQVAALYMLTRLIYNVSQVFLPLYVNKTLKLEKFHIALVPLTVFVSGFVTTIVTKPLIQLIGRKLAYLVGLVFVAASCGFLLWPDIGLKVYGSVVLLGIGSSTILVASLSITADLIGKNTECSGFVFGSMSFCDKLSNGLAVQAIELFVPNMAECVVCRFYYQTVLVYVVGGFVIAAFVVILLLLPQTIGKRRSLSVSLTSSEESDDLRRPLLGPSHNAAPVTDISYGTIDEEPSVPKAPSMVRTAPALVGPRAPTPTEEALHAAYTEHPIVGSYGAVKTLTAPPPASGAVRRDDYADI